MLIVQHPITFLWRVYVKPFPARILWISGMTEQGCGYSRDIQNIGLVLLQFRKEIPGFNNPQRRANGPDQPARSEG
jgi:hypothetical protein